MRERLSRFAWPALVIVAFCAPLFTGLGDFDLQGDEAGHSFSVDLILEQGEWLIPKSSPHPDYVFLEKPPLKFWIVAAGILAGLPHDEFGLRFWDAIFGGLAFLYVFAIGRRLDGPLCGAVAVLLLFVHRNLLFEHGLRTNNMEAPLVLAYCGGVYHYLAWTTSADRRRRWRHVIAIALYFVLGFMVKFVAALFLPTLLGLVSLLVGRYRADLFRDWRLWLTGGLVALALIAPWFVYCTYLFGMGFWDMILGAQVYTRLTAYLDPAHLKPWNHYLIETYERWRDAGAFWLVAAGAVLLAADTIRRRWAEGLVVLLWFAVPVTIISFGTSKLYHYAYPFLPPVGLAGGYLISRFWRVLQPAVNAMSADWVFARIARWSPGLAANLRRPAIRNLLVVLALVAVAMFAWTVLVGPFNFTVAGLTVRNSRLLRPALIAVLLLTLAGRPRLMGRLVVAFLILAALPLPAYRTTLRALGDTRRVFRPTRDCVLRVGSRPELMASGPRGMYVDGSGTDAPLPFNHEFNYYFRHVVPWSGAADASPSRLYQFVADPAEQRPLLLSASRYHALLPEFTKAAGRPLSLPRVVLHDDNQLVLPGPYAVCDAGHLLLQQQQ